MRASSSAASSRRNRSSIPSHSTTARHLVRETPAEAREVLGAGLEVAPAQHPRVARHDPADLVRIGPLLEQPHARVHPGLARTHHREVIEPRSDRGQPTDRNAGHVVGHGIRGWRRGRHLHPGVRRVDEAAALHPAPSSGQQRCHHPVVVDFARGQERDPPRRQEPVPHHGVEMRHDLMTRRQFVEPGVEPGLIDRPCAERPRAHPVVAGGLVQPHERVCLVPVATRSIMPIDDHHRRVGVAEQLIREGHPNGAGPLDQVVGLDHFTIGLPHLASLDTPAAPDDQTSAPHFTRCSCRFGGDQVGDPQNQRAAATSNSARGWGCSRGYPSRPDQPTSSSSSCSDGLRHEHPCGNSTDPVGIGD